MRYLACEDGALNPETGVCTSEVWVESPSLRDMLPTVEQANEVGMAIFGVLVAIHALKTIFRPSNDRTE